MGYNFTYTGTPRLTDSMRSEHLVVKSQIRNDVEYKLLSMSKGFR
jgi:hypothetical protein